MTKNHCLFIGKTSSLPPESESKEHEILYCLDEIDNIEDKDVENIELEYLVIILYKTTNFLNSEVEYIQAEWKELTGGSISVDLFETRRKRINKGFRELFDEYDDNQVIFKSPFVSYMKSSKKGYLSAVNLIKNAALKPVWMFWK